MQEYVFKLNKRPDDSQVIEYNNPLFYCFFDKHRYPKDNAYRVGEHWHEDIEIMYVTDGVLNFRVNGENLVLKKGEGIFVNSRRIHSNWTKKGEECEFICTIMHPSYFCASPYIEQKYIAPLLSNSSFDYLLLSQNDWTKEIGQGLDELFKQRADAASFELKILENAYKYMRLIYENYDTSSILPQTAPIHLNTFKQMLNYLQNHYMEKLSLDEIAKAGNVGKTLCAKLFKKYVNATPGDYLITYRIVKSTDMLRNTDLSITDIAYKCGFTSGSHFTKTFGEIIGCTPNKYRNLGCNELGYAGHLAYLKQN